MDETKWMSEKMRKKKSKPYFSEIGSHKKILLFLEALHINMEEVMYIYTYRKNDFHPFLNLEDMWDLYELDSEWSLFSKFRMRIQ